jgi:hypothetical protein
VRGYRKEPRYECLTDRAYSSGCAGYRQRLAGYEQRLQKRSTRLVRIMHSTTESGAPITSGPGSMVTTKIMPAGLLGVVMVLLVSSHAAALGRDELLKSCEAVLSVANPENSQSIEIPAAGLPCWYYMAAVQDMSTIVDQNGQHLLGVCAPSTTSLLDYVRTFVRNEKSNTASAGKNVAAQELTALLKAFPCH